MNDPVSPEQCLGSSTTNAGQGISDFSTKRSIDILLFILKLLRIGHDAQPVSGGRFLPKFAAEVGFFCLRLSGMAAILVCRFPMLDFHGLTPESLSATYGFLHVVGLAFKVRTQMRSFYWVVDSLQLLTDVLYASFIMGLFHNLCPNSVLLFLAAC
jgi:hypothetical protein